MSRMNWYTQCRLSEVKRSNVMGSHEDDALNRYLDERAKREEEHEQDCGCRECWKPDDEE